jgi:hypothetical protein
MKINSALKLKHVAGALGALVAVILFIAVAHSSAKASVQLSRLNWILRSPEITPPRFDMPLKGRHFRHYKQKVASDANQR